MPADNNLIDEILRWRPWPGPDPALPLLLGAADENTRQQVLVALVEQQRTILQAQVEFTTRLLGILSTRGGGPAP